MNVSNEKQDERLWEHHQTDNVQNLEIGHPRQDMLFGHIKRLLNSRSRILEIGFGDGYLLKKLSPEYECYGADVSEKNVGKMQQDVQGVNFKTIGVDGILPYQDNYFDLFVASEVLEHMPDEELGICVQEIGRVLKKGGYAVVTFPVRENLKESECFCPNCGHVFHRWGHKQYWDAKKIKNVFGDFTLLRIEEFFTPYAGKNFLEKLVGFGMWCIRNTANRFIDVPGKTYLVIMSKG